MLGNEHSVLEQTGADPTAEAEKYLDEEKGVASTDEALQGAMDIIAEDISDNADLRKYLRALFNDLGKLVSVAADDTQKSVYG